MQVLYLCLNFCETCVCVCVILSFMKVYSLSSFFNENNESVHALMRTEFFCLWAQQTRDCKRVLASIYLLTHTTRTTEDMFETDTLLSKGVYLPNCIHSSRLSLLKWAKWLLLFEGEEEAKIQNRERCILQIYNVWDAPFSLLLDLELKVIHLDSWLLSEFLRSKFFLSLLDKKNNLYIF